MTCTAVSVERSALETARDNLGPDTQSRFTAALDAWNRARVAHVTATGCPEHH